MSNHSHIKGPIIIKDLDNTFITYFRCIFICSNIVFVRYCVCKTKVIKRTALSIADGYGYEDTEELVWLPSMTEMGYGKNNNVQETAVFDGEPVDSPFELFDGASNDDRIKSYSGVARYWWLRSPLPSFASYERCVLPSGALYNYSAFYSSGVPAGLTLM